MINLFRRQVRQRREWPKLGGVPLGKMRDKYPLNLYEAYYNYRTARFIKAASVLQDNFAVVLIKKMQECYYSYTK